MMLKGFAKIRGRGLLASASLPVLTAGLLMASPAIAQDAPERASGNDEIVVTGVRAALEDAAGRKRDALTVVDSVTATDIGAFPDKSAAEALQRIPGITVNRLQSADDSTHVGRASRPTCSSAA